MMRIGFLDLDAGISGDMILAALLDAGAPAAAVEAAFAAVGEGRLGLRTTEVRRAGIRALKADVLVDGEPVREGGGPVDPPEPDAPPPHAAPHRSWSEVDALLLRAPLDARVRDLARRALLLLGEAEGAAHGVVLDAVHFHEVGSLDAIGDIVGTAAAFVALGLDRLLHGPVNVGGGTVTAAHGRLPVPAPATARLLEGRPIVLEPGAGELTTPTGAALLAALAEPAPSRVAMRPDRTGWGAGRKDPPAFPNVVRLVVGTREERGAGGEGEVAVLEAAVDDMTGEEAGFVLETLLAEGALDAAWTPVVMKKSRPGLLLRVVARPEDADRLADRVLAATTSLGVRLRFERRRELARRIDALTVDGATVRVKVASLPGGGERPHVEFEDLRRFVEATGLGAHEARRRIERAWEERR